MDNKPLLSLSPSAISLPNRYSIAVLFFLTIVAAIPATAPNNGPPEVNIVDANPPTTLPLLISGKDLVKALLVADAAFSTSVPNRVYTNWFILFHMESWDA